MWNVSAIVKEADLDDLLLDQLDKWLLIVRDTLITGFIASKPIYSRFMLHAIYCVNQSSFPIGYPKDFSMAHHIVLTYVAHVVY